MFLALSDVMSFQRQMRMQEGPGPAIVDLVVAGTCKGSVELEGCRLQFYRACTCTCNPIQSSPESLVDRARMRNADENAVRVKMHCEACSSCTCRLDAGCLEGVRWCVVVVQQLCCLSVGLVEQQPACKFPQATQSRGHQSSHSFQTAPSGRACNFSSSFPRMPNHINAPLRYGMLDHHHFQRRAWSERWKAVP